MKRPAFQFYPADWRKDAALQTCSLCSRGLWAEMLCIMHECEPYGTLSVNGKPMGSSQLSRLVGEAEKPVLKLLNELEEAGVFSRDDDGRIYSRRMVNDERVRNIRAEGGKAGAEHGIKGAEFGKKGGRPPKNKGGLKTPLTDEVEDEFKPPPSSSSSSSSTSTPKDKAAPSSFNALAYLESLDVDRQVASDWLDLRKTRKAKSTKTAFDEVLMEATKAGVSMDAAVRTCCKRNWTGFEAHWMKKDGGGGSGQLNFHDDRKRVMDELTGRNRNAAVDEFNIIDV